MSQGIDQKRDAEDTIVAPLPDSPAGSMKEDENAQSDDEEEARQQALGLLNDSDPNRKTTTQRELWSWYLYYVGNSGLGPFNFQPTQFQVSRARSVRSRDWPVRRNGSEGRMTGRS